MVGAILGCSLALCAAATGSAQQGEFPLNSELILDVDPMPGSKRIPGLDVAGDGSITLQTWCRSIGGKLIVAGDTITVLLDAPADPPPDDRACPPERAKRDADLLAALGAVTNWRRDGDFVLLVGPQSLKFRIPTN